ncbi:MAG: hypothetical protein ACHQ4H_07795, partial [Ktedonobacterales bacterium]
MTSRPIGVRAATLDPELLVGVAAATPGMSDWSLEMLRDEEAQLYLIGSQVEARRQVNDDRARLTVYSDHPPVGPNAGPLARGAATVTLLAGDAADPQALAARLRDAVAAARLTDNPPFALPGMPSDGYPSVATYDTALDGDLPALLDETAARVQAAVAAEPEVRLSSAELYATRSARGFRNSRGAQSAGRGTRIALDLVLIAGEGESAAEMHGDFTR